MTTEDYLELDQVDKIAIEETTVTLQEAVMEEVFCTALFHFLKIIRLQGNQPIYCRHIS